MPMPNLGDYCGAVQYATNFSDRALQAGQVAMSSKFANSPLSWAGAFGVVFCVRCQLGSYAVKCFTAAQPERAQRYAEISAYLPGCAPNAAPFLVSVGYDNQGIFVHPARYPLLKMEWVQGDRLNDHVEKVLASPDPISPLRDLATRWTELVLALQKDQIAHGDLQHGNVLVLGDGSLKLVDYDGMYVPPLAKRHALEQGHYNYQHPARESHYNERLDDFAALAILTAIRGLAVDTGLWNQFNGGENMLFVASDFRDPPRSPLFDKLAQLPDPAVAYLAEQLRKAAQAKVLADVAQFKDVVAGMPGGAFVRCAKCGNWYEGGHFWCDQCGARNLAAACRPPCSSVVPGTRRFLIFGPRVERRCGFAENPLSPEWKYCPGCGEPLPAP